MASRPLDLGDMFNIAADVLGQPVDELATEDPVASAKLAIDVLEARAERGEVRRPLPDRLAMFVRVCLTHSTVGARSIRRQRLKQLRDEQRLSAVRVPYRKVSLPALAGSIRRRCVRASRIRVAIGV